MNTFHVICLVALFTPLTNPAHGSESVQKTDQKSIQSRETQAAKAILALKSGDRGRQDAAMVSLRQLPSSTVGPAVVPLLMEKKSSTRRFTMKLLREIEYEAPARRIRRILLSDSDPKVRREACHTITALYPKEAVEPLVSAASLDIDVSVKRAALLDLGRLKSREALDALIDYLEGMLEHDDEYLQKITIQALTLCTGKSLGTNVEGWRHFAKSFKATQDEED